MDKWNKKTGMCEPDEILPVMNAEISDADVILAYYSDRFQACEGSQMRDFLQDVSRLLEIRAFNGEKELWLHRSQLGRPFVWRIASEEGCVAERDYIETIQALDIDETYAAYRNGETDEFGCLKMRSTVKGYYALPIRKTDAFVKLIEYVRYDEDGIAGIADYRVAGFAPSGKERS